MEGFINKLKNNNKFRIKYNDILKFSKDSVENDIIAIRGLYFGYPKCCIKYYIENINNIPQTCTDASENTGFIPCETCSQKILNKKKRIHNLINKRFCKVSFIDYKSKDDNNELEKYTGYFLELFDPELKNIDNIDNIENISNTDINQNIYKFKNNLNIKNLIKYYPQYANNEKFLQKVTKFDGKYWGYPVCCIKYFIANRGYLKEYETIDELCKLASNNTGFYPCPIHAQHVVDKFIKISDLIKDSRKAKYDFPNEEPNENLSYLLHVTYTCNF